jgi:NAD(P)-dependent dehydrogenase (short-subunit alcohol dehydrogenase family)
MNNDFSGKVVLVTGAGKGKGRALAEAFMARGAFVAVNDMSPINLDELVSRGGGKVKAYADDVAKKVAMQAIVNQVEDDFGKIDILINHAAVKPHVDLLAMDEWDWHRVLDVNLTGMFLSMQSVGRVMREKGSGVILNLITATHLEGEKDAAYLSSMMGALELSRLASIEFAPYGIHVHALTTGLTKFHQADPSIPENFLDAALFLCELNLFGQIVNVKTE